MTATLKPAMGPSLIAKEIIEAHYSDLIEHNAIPEFVFSDQGIHRRGRDCVGVVSLCSGDKSYWRSLARSSSDQSAFFLIKIDYDIWEPMDDTERRAWIDHYLAYCHADLTETGQRKLSINYAIEMFPAVVKRHGFFMDGLEAAAKAFKPHMAQPGLFDANLSDEEFESSAQPIPAPVDGFDDDPAAIRAEIDNSIRAAQRMTGVGAAVTASSYFATENNATVAFQTNGEAVTIGAIGERIANGHKPETITQARKPGRPRKEAAQGHAAA